MYSYCDMPKQLQNKTLIKQMVSCIKTIRKQKAITLEVFYFDTGIHLARIEQGKQNISVATLALICGYFEISLSDFFKMVENVE
jgi:transcriptional regulator with XRE-family HTH domain